VTPAQAGLGVLVGASGPHFAVIGRGRVRLGIFLVLTFGVVPGARIGARIALGARERALRVTVGVFLLVVAVAYGASELASPPQDRG